MGSTGAQTDPSFRKRVLLSCSSAPGKGLPVAESETQTAVNACLGGKGSTTGKGRGQEALLTLCCVYLQPKDLSKRMYTDSGWQRKDLCDSLVRKEL